MQSSTTVETSRRNRRAQRRGDAVASVRTPAEPELAAGAGDLHACIAKRAYQLYLERGADEGSALDDWLQAEQQIMSSEDRRPKTVEGDRLNKNGPVLGRQRDMRGSSKKRANTECDLNTISVKECVANTLDE